MRTDHTSPDSSSAASDKQDSQPTLQTEDQTGGSVSGHIQSHEVVTTDNGVPQNYKGLDWAAIFAEVERDKEELGQEAYEAKYPAASKSQA